MRSHYLALLLPLLIFGCESKIIVSVNAPNKSSAVSSTDTATSSATETVVLSTKGGSVIVGASAFAQTADIALGEGSIASFLESAGLPSTTVVDAGPIKLSSLVSGTSTPVEPQSAINVRVNVSSKQSLGADTSAVIVVTDKDGKATIFYVRHDSLKIETDAKTGQRYVDVGSIKSGNFAVALVSGLSSELLASKFTSLPADGDVSQPTGMNPTAGAFLASTSVGETQFTLNWSAGSDIVTAAASLQYFVCSGASSAAIDSVEECEAASSEMAYVANTLTLAITGKSASTTYYYNVVVKDVDGHRSIYDGKSQATTNSTDSTAPTAGAFSASSGVGAGAFTLNWPAASDVGTAVASLTYFVCSGASSAAIDTVAECEAATSEMAYTANTLTLALTGKSPSTTYYYNVIVKDGGANKSLYNGKSQATTADSTVPTAGTFSASTGVSATAFTLNWSAASDDGTAVGSLQYFACSGASSAAIDTVAECEAATSEMAYTANTLTLAITGKTVSTTYYYNVVVKDAGNNKALYNGNSQATTADTTVPTAGIFSASTGVGNTAFTLNWAAATDNVTAGASLQYFVCSGGSTAAIDTVAECEAATSEMAYTANTLTLAITGKSPSTTYYYNVVVKDAASNKSLYDGKPQATTADTTVPTAGTFSLSTGVGATAFTLNWSVASDNVTAAASLQYFVCSGASSADIDTVAECEAATSEMAYTANTLTKAITGKTPSTTYYYNVVVKDAANNKSLYDGMPQGTTADTTVPTAGTFSVSTSVTDTTFTLNWSVASDNVTAAASLQYFVCSGASSADIDTVAECEGATSEMAYTANTLTKAITGKTASTTYYYNVVVKDAASNKSLYDGISQATSAGGSSGNSWTATATTSVPLARTLHTVVWTGSKMIIWGGQNDNDGYDSGGIYDPVSDSWTATTTTSAPLERYSHSVVWTGSKMIVWGGMCQTLAGPDSSGGIYDPVTNSWSATNTTNAPTARYSHSAVWTGSKMIVFGGKDIMSTYFETGGQYDPVANSWSSTTTTNAASGRIYHTAVWTGSQMIIFSGRDGVNVYSNIAKLYNPSTDVWTSATTTNAPTAFDGHSAVWTGSKMIVWGGTGTNTGGVYDPTLDTWSATTTTNAPTNRAGHSAIWNGSEMIVWGGAESGVSFSTGALYNPVANSWTATTTTSAPAGRHSHSVVWTGSKMIVWSGYQSGGTYLSTGGVYTPAPVSGTNTWSATTTTSAAGARYFHNAVWTGSKMIAWGGHNGTSYLNTGGLYDPVADSWSATATTNAPSARGYHTAIWTGSKMIAWGGSNGSYLNTGGLYDPVANTWSATTTTGAPDARYLHTAVWTGSKVIAWGGNTTSETETGGVYNPESDSWTATTTTGAPVGRNYHTAVWTGSKMIVWGGATGMTYLNTGGLYNPETNSWSATTTTGVPTARQVHSTVWTGSKMIVWGGQDTMSTCLDNGGVYNPVANSWTATTSTGAAAARFSHKGVWTGAKMLIFGGSDMSSRINSGGLYDPEANSWSATTTTNAPSVRYGSSAIWTGASMIIWGGSNPSNASLNTGGIYIP